MAPTTMGQRLKKARLEKGLTQVQLAKKSGASSHTIICDYESGKRGKKRPDIKLLVKIAEILDISIDYLFLGRESNKNK
jgi:transcriptional regulator with XRE-family HTH domain